MKKVVLFTFLSLCFISGYSQKKKTSKTAPTTAKGVLAKADNLVVEVKTGSFQITINENAKPKDALLIKTVDAKFAPTDVKLIPFTANGTKLYLLAWTEKTLNKTDLKTENITTIYSNIYEITSKKQVFINTQLTNNSVEKVFLDRLKNASETQEKVRKEGFEFFLNSDGSVTQKSKNQENKWIYDPASMEYIDAKKKKK